MRLGWLEPFWPPGQRGDVDPAARSEAPKPTTDAAGAPPPAPPNARAIGALAFAFLSVALGVVAGVGAFGFRMLIGLVHNAFFLGRLAFDYDSSVHTPAAPWGHAVVLAPVVGGMIVVFLVENFAPEARGHGVPEVMDAIYYGKSVIRPVVAFVKSLASATSIGSGGSVGREGPIIQIGAALASWLGRVARVSRWQLATLVAAGGGAGIAATFNTPIGGVLFAVEVLLHEVSVRTLVPVALATATATYVGQRLLGDHPAFDVPKVHMSVETGAAILPAYAALGLLTAVVAVVFTRSVYGAEDRFERWLPRSPYRRHAVGMLGVGVLAETLRVWLGHYYVQGVGYATIEDIVSGRLDEPPILVVLFLAKLLATSATLGSGASGGVFSPSLFLGATLGGACGVALKEILPGLGVDPTALALAGMAGVVAGATGAAITSIAMIFEMTRDYSVVLPMTITVAVSHGVRRALSVENIYTMKLARRGHSMPQALQANAYMLHHAGEIVAGRATLLPDSTPVRDLTSRLVDPARTFVVATDGDRVVGFLSRRDAIAAVPIATGDATLAQIVARDFILTAPETTLFDLVGELHRHHAAAAVLRTVQGEIRAVVTRDDVVESIAEGMELFED
jgi:CIC family chloride channel protein